MAYTTVREIPDEVIRERNRLVREVNRGRFWKPCPGTGADYYCCGYQILTPLTGCGMYCSYCVLQEYYEHQYQVVYDNFDDCAREIAAGMARRRGVIRFGTGEFADSLYLEERLGISQKIASLLQPYSNVLVEFKTKSASVRALDVLADPRKVVIGFSMNTPRMIGLLEKGTASLEQRLEAAAYCESRGFWVAFHFDPMIWYPQWKKEYLSVVERIFSTIRDPRHIAWWSMGGFRTMPALKKRLRESGRHLPLFCGEMVLGDDKKLRYFRPVRVAFYRAMREAVDAFYPATTLYLCMESREAWEEAGMCRRIPDGLASYLDRRAETMLGMREERGESWQR